MIIGGSRGCGKTTELIKESSSTWTYIICADSNRARFISRLANDLKINIPYPITASELPLQGIYLKEVLVDDLEDVLSFLIGKEVKHATSSHELKVIQLNKKLIKK
jgi:hypothetical protein